MPWLSRPVRGSLWLALAFGAACPGSVSAQAVSLEPETYEPVNVPTSTPGPITLSTERLVLATGGSLDLEVVESPLGSSENRALFAVSGGAGTLQDGSPICRYGTPRYLTVTLAEDIDVGPMLVLEFSASETPPTQPCQQCSTYFYEGKRLPIWEPPQPYIAEDPHACFRAAELEYESLVAEREAREMEAQRAREALVAAHMAEMQSQADKEARQLQAERESLRREIEAAREFERQVAERERRNPSPRLSPGSSSIEVGHPRWSEAAIALGQAGASGCGEFNLSASGVAYCVDSGQSWTIRGGVASLR